MLRFKLSVIWMVCTCIICLCPHVVYSQTKDPGKYTQLHFSISFAKDSHAIDSLFSNNREQLHRLEELLSGISTIHRITIYSNSSPDGALWRNTQLSQMRGKAVEGAIASLIHRHGVELEEDMDLVVLPEDWAGLEKLVEQQYNRADKGELIAILNSSHSQYKKKQLIKQLGGGESFKFLMQSLMPQLRKSVVITMAVPSYLSDEAFEQLLENLPEPAQQPVAKPQPQLCAMDCSYESQVQEKKKEYIFNLKTNLLLPLLNVGVEVPIKEKYTVGAEFYYPWIKPANNRWCSQMLAWFVEGKYWHTPKHGFGIYAGAGYYDFQNSKEGYQGEFIDVGADYTYSISVGKKKWMKVQFNIGVGYIFSTARHYYPKDDYQILIKDPAVKSKNSHFVGPTRGGISLVFPIAKFWKGGER